MRCAPLCLLLALVGAGGSTAQKAIKEKESERSPLSPALDLLPAGSTLKGVRIPRYDKEKRRAALLRAGVLKVVSEDRVHGTDIRLRLFSKEEEETLRLRMGAAEYSRESGLLEAHELITVSGENVKARGAGGLFHLEKRKGFVRGPVYTTFLRPPEKDGEESQKAGTQPPPSKPARKASVAIIADDDPEFLEPQAFTLAELEELDALLKSESKSVLADRAPTRELMTRSEQLSQAAEVGLRSFTHLVRRRNLLAAVQEGRPELPLPTNTPLAKGEVQVNCEGGMFIDTEKGHISYLRNITVAEARFSVSCSNALKAFFEKKEIGGKNQPAPEDFADLKTIVASGGVRVLRHDPKRKRPPIIATAETVIVDVKTGDMVLQGGSPAIEHGLNAIRAGEPDLYLRYYANGNVFAEKGRWTTVGDLASLKTGNDQDRAASDSENRKPDPEAPIDAGGEQGLNEKPVPEPQLITATCTGGIYFDARAGQIVYLENVEIQEPRFSLTGADELKVFLRRRPDAAPEDLEGPEAWSDVDAIVASGQITVLRKDAAGKRKPISASAAHAVFQARSGDMILRGGTPAIRQGANSLVAGQPGLYLRFYNNGSLFTEPGTWTTTGDLANLRNKKGEPKKPQNIITATCKGGVRFDSLKGQIVYSKGIVVKEARFTLHCAGEMTIHLSRRENADEDRLEGPEAFSDVKVLVATGGVKVVRSHKGAPVTASADTATYDASKGDIVLRGGFPMIRRGQSFLRASEPGLYILFKSSGQVRTNKGKWITEGRRADFKELGVE